MDEESETPQSSSSENASIPGCAACILPIALAQFWAPAASAPAALSNDPRGLGGESDKLPPWVGAVDDGVVSMADGDEAPEPVLTDSFIWAIIGRVAGVNLSPLAPANSDSSPLDLAMGVPQCHTVLARPCPDVSPAGCAVFIRRRLLPPGSSDAAPLLPLLALTPWE